MKHTILALLMAAGLVPVAQAEEELTGDVKLACEAILCLSTGSRPSECSPSIKKYFSYTNVKFHKVLDWRKGFLGLCPASSDPGMPELVNAIANGAGRCDAAELNRLNRKTVTYYVWKRSIHMGDGYVRQSLTTYGNDVPSYCKAYGGHEWTDGVMKAKYQGNLWPYADGYKFPQRSSIPKADGRWVDN